MGSVAAFKLGTAPPPKSISPIVRSLPAYPMGIITAIGLSTVVGQPPMTPANEPCRQFYFWYCPLSEILEIIAAEVIAHAAHSTHASHTTHSSHAAHPTHAAHSSTVRHRRRRH